MSNHIFIDETMMKRHTMKTSCYSKNAVMCSMQLFSYVNHVNQFDACMCPFIWKSKNNSTFYSCLVLPVGQWYFNESDAVSMLKA